MPRHHRPGFSEQQFDDGFIEPNLRPRDSAPTRKSDDEDTDSESDKGSESSKQSDSHKYYVLRDGTVTTEVPDDRSQIYSSHSISTPAEARETYGDRDDIEEIVAQQRQKTQHFEERVNRSMGDRPSVPSDTLSTTDTAAPTDGGQSGDDLSFHVETEPEAVDQPQDLAEAPIDTTSGIGPGQLNTISYTGIDTGPIEASEQQEVVREHDAYGGEDWDGDGIPDGFQTMNTTAPAIQGDDSGGEDWDGDGIPDGFQSDEAHSATTTEGFGQKYGDYVEGGIGVSDEVQARLDAQERATREAEQALNNAKALADAKNKAELERAAALIAAADARRDAALQNVENLEEAADKINEANAVRGAGQVDAADAKRDAALQNVENLEEAADKINEANAVRGAGQVDAADAYEKSLHNTEVPVSVDPIAPTSESVHREFGPPTDAPGSVIAPTSESVHREFGPPAPAPGSVHDEFGAKTTSTPTQPEKGPEIGPSVQHGAGVDRAGDATAVAAETPRYTWVESAGYRVPMLESSNTMFDDPKTVLDERRLAAIEHITMSQLHRDRNLQTPTELAEEKRRSDAIKEKRERDREATRHGIANFAADVFIPGYATARTWNQSSNFQRGLGLGLDGLSLLPIGALAAKSVRGGVGLTRGLLRGGEALVKGPVQTIRHPIESGKALYRLGDQIIGPKTVPISALESMTSTTRIPVGPFSKVDNLAGVSDDYMRVARPGLSGTVDHGVDAAAAAKLAGDDLTQKLTTGQDALTDVGGVQVKMTSTPFQRTTGPAVFSTGPDITPWKVEGGSRGFVSAEGKSFFAPGYLSRFDAQSAFGNYTPPGGQAGAVIIRDTDLIADLGTSGKTYTPRRGQELVEIESTLPQPKDFPEASQVLKTYSDPNIVRPGADAVDEYAAKLDELNMAKKADELRTKGEIDLGRGRELPVIGEPLSLTDIYKLKLRGAAENIRRLNPRFKHTDISYSGVDDVASAADDLAAAGKTDQAAFVRSQTKNIRNVDDLMRSSEDLAKAGYLDEAAALRREADDVLRQLDDAAREASGASGTLQMGRGFLSAATQRSGADGLSERRESDGEAGPTDARSLNGVRGAGGTRSGSDYPDMPEDTLRGGQPAEAEDAVVRGQRGGGEGTRPTGGEWPDGPERPPEPPDVPERPPEPPDVPERPPEPPDGPERPPEPPDGPERPPEPPDVPERPPEPPDVPERPPEPPDVPERPPEPPDVPERPPEPPDVPERPPEPPDVPDRPPEPDGPDRPPEPPDVPERPPEPPDGPDRPPEPPDGPDRPPEPDGPDRPPEPPDGPDRPPEPPDVPGGTRAAGEAAEPPSERADPANISEPPHREPEAPPRDQDDRRARTITPLPPPTDVIRARDQDEMHARRLRTPDDESSQQLDAPEPAPRPPGSFPRAIEHNEQVEYSYDPDTDRFHAKLISASEPVVTAWDKSPPHRDERPVGTWDVTANNDGIQVTDSGRVGWNEDTKEELRRQAQQTGARVSTVSTMRYRHDIDSQDTQNFQMDGSESLASRARGFAGRAAGRVGGAGRSAVAGARSLAADTAEGVASGLERNDQLADAQSRFESARDIMATEEQARIDALSPNARAAERSRGIAARLRGDPTPDIPRSARYTRAQEQYEQSAEEIRQIKGTAPAGFGARAGSLGAQIAAAVRREQEKLRDRQPSDLAKRLAADLKAQQKKKAPNRRRRSSRRREKLPAHTPLPKIVVTVNTPSSNRRIGL